MTCFGHRPHRSAFTRGGPGRSSTLRHLNGLPRFLCTASSPTSPPRYFEPPVSKQFVHVSVTVPSLIVQLPPSQVIFALEASPPLVT